MDTAYWHQKMKYVTACPNCGTQFLLNDALIKAHRGKVQCGHCEHVFNAKNRLTEVTDDTASTEDDQANEREVGIETAHGLTTEEVIVTDNKQDTIDELTQPEIEEQTVNVDAIFASKRQANKPRQYSFLIKLISFLLIIVAALQATYFLRHAIARQFPVIKPLLERACTPLKCTIDLSKDLDLITIGDSDMQEDDTYQSVIKFSSSIKNNARYPQAYPNIELTLTDSDDRAVIKKLITPKSYLESTDKIKYGLAPQETAALALSLYVTDPSVASYRILLFY
jgi:predicted Zn finger-like uncharacterized protein